ncbi:hypothetical protein SSABA_v1c04260 [Spiroplasma sabaudiense Ar-1343]|uniref:Type II methyltransferase M.TaqI-like domain-containing protein n=1 Tax=Spiroplasma sabaudiense Ar-1343 TaxID=1276257 RepID=W6AAG5_9MOLU|nr:hypothetical protein [Spiroplasma sabaudiense]AHI53835.1 hypothetical protein SSABA_v1c04260 [Spiroplasma sabaudiense Ar-1343]
MKKNELGQFFTVKSSWITKPVLDFIKENTKKRNIILDPFAGQGDLFESLRGRLKREDLYFLGFDIDKDLKWTINDSLERIPLTQEENTFIVTNPPYLAKNSCKRNGYERTYENYFEKSEWTDLYLIAMQRMVDLKIPGVAIVPETFINSKFSKEFINRIVIIEPNPFNDTEVPICIVCFDGSKRQDCVIFKNNSKIDSLENLKLLNPKNESLNLNDLRFNDIAGSIALRGVDSTNPSDKIRFLDKNELGLSILKIKNSSRAITVLNSSKLSNLDENQIKKIIDFSNKYLNDYRESTCDVLLTPFKGNNKENIRRRRLDFKLAKAIIEKAYKNIILGDNNGTKLRLKSQNAVEK